MHLKSWLCSWGTDTHVKTVLMKKKKKGFRKKLRREERKKKTRLFFLFSIWKMKQGQKKLTILPVFGKKLEGKQLKLKSLFQITPKVQLLTLATPYCIYRSWGQGNYPCAGMFTDQVLQWNEGDCSPHNGIDSWFTDVYKALWFL